MKESTKSTVTMIATICCAVVAVVPSSGIFGEAVQRAALYISPVATFAFGLLFGWTFRSRVIVPERRTPHNELCRKMLSDLAELPKGERYPYVEKLLAHDRVDGSHATLNALESLVAQGCVRGCEVRWHLDGDAGFYADSSFGPTGKRYIND